MVPFHIIKSSIRCFFFAAQSSTVITVNQGVRGGKVTELKKTVDTAVQSCPAVKQVFVAMRTETPVTMTARDIAMEEVREQRANEIGVSLKSKYKPSRVTLVKKKNQNYKFYFDLFV